jgi:hypothetical protein
MEMNYEIARAIIVPISLLLPSTLRAEEERLEDVPDGKGGGFDLPDVFITATCSEAKRFELPFTAHLYEGREIHGK